MLKGISTQSSKFRESACQLSRKTVFEKFGRQFLVDCILSVEDNVKIVISQILGSFLPEYFAMESEAKAYSTIDRILANLTHALKEADDLEGSVIFIFELINEVLVYPSFKINQSKFRIDSEIFFPFNFHRSTKARIMFCKLINKFLRIP